MRIKQQIEALELELSFMEDNLVKLERNGVYGGPEYDDIALEMREIEHDIDQLRLADEDDMC